MVPSLANGLMPEPGGAFALGRVRGPFSITICACVGLGPPTGSAPLPARIRAVALGVSMPGFSGLNGSQKPRSTSSGHPPPDSI